MKKNIKNNKKQYQVPVYFLIGILVLLHVNACIPGRVIEVRQPVITLQRGTNDFLAGAAEVDITPPPGLPLFGFAIGSTGNAKGYWTRLKARVIVFQNGRGERTALVQLDLGAVSGLLHRETAKRLASSGFEPANLLMAASHTHAAPGGFFGEKFYNRLGSGRPGFFRHLVTWLAERICAGVNKACANLAPARVGAGMVTVKGLSRNRSLDAWLCNFETDRGQPPYMSVIPDVYLLRVDHVRGDGTVPTAAFVVAPVHATAMGKKNKLYHGDLHGVASRYLAAMVTQKYQLNRPFVAAVVSGPQGDVSPRWDKQGMDETKRLGALLAEKAGGLFRSLDGKLQKCGPQYIYSEPRIQGAQLREGKLCEKPMIGVPALGGAEDGRSIFYGKFSVVEGRKRKHPKGCQEVKARAGGFLQPLLVKPGALPEFAPLQMIRFGDMISFVTIPAEPTTETGYRIKEALRHRTNTRYTAVVAAANEYMSYVATPEEYAAQHFEGAMTLYGPLEPVFFRERLEDLVKRAGSGKSEFSPVRRFKPGRSQKLFIRGKSARPAEWRGLYTTVKHRPDGKLQSVRFTWYGLRRYFYCKELPTISVVSGDSTLTGPLGVPETDHWFNFIVKRHGPRIWSALWTPPEDIVLTEKYRIKVSRPGHDPLLSDIFFQP